MQLTSHPNPSPTTAASAARPALRLALGTAVAALLAPVAPLAQAAADAPASPTARVPWQVDSAVLLYAENGGRVKAVEPVIALRRTDADDHTLSLKLTVDTLTGASPNGAVAQPGAQTFTSPSGNQSYTTAAGSTPLDPSFKDTRGALSVGYERPLGRMTRLSVGGNFSQEYDFTSLGTSLAVAHDLDGRNTTLSLGLALEANQMRPVGGTPVGLSVASANGPRLGNGSRNVADVLLGLTQVMNRRWLMQVNLGLGRGSGEHSDPYKILSVVDGSTGLLAGDRYVHESRPDSRSRTSLYWGHKVHLARDVLDLSWRGYRDDWGVRSHTLDARWRVNLGGGRYLEPRWRHHRQSAADFWRGWLVDGQDWDSTGHSTTLSAASADPRLAKFSGNTLGLTWGQPLSWGGELTLRGEVYRQVQATPANAPGVLQGLPIAPGLTATMLTAGYRFNW
ncbi:DUF3570 domain-containing protein [Sphaerotilus mobilis]|uniref:Uncharacterized protein DUF3570 n=1 Tax=Sphaerotilus mobilis TaxID=47994 RepID=A0A4V2EWS3_9BURK|nr:DUF3570 domain-containing protein [Sphaerotilus mobilis]RZS56990.1 uncharacterized protein DUF3570 [Sphaerotilus mobilis]